jgi:hypothetical protein
MAGVYQNSCSFSRSVQFSTSAFSVKAPGSLRTAERFNCLQNLHNGAIQPVWEGREPSSRNMGSLWDGFHPFRYIPQLELSSTTLTFVQAMIKVFSLVSWETLIS